MSPAPATPPAPASVSLFDLSAEAPVLRGVSLVSQAPGEAQAGLLPTSCPGSGKKASPERKVVQGPLDISEKLFCSACNQSFQNHQEQREHYKLDWHRFNLKQHLKSRPLLSALDFEKRSCTGELSSISGSEDSDSASEKDLQTLGEERAEYERPNRPRGFYPHQVLFQNAQGQFLHAYRCVLGPHQVPPDEAELLLQRLQNGGPRHCVVLMAAAGHFAGAIFQGREVVTHKTFHRYTVRAKRGTAQGLRDAQGRPSRSAGANLRRYNEATLYKDVRDLLTGPGWAEALEQAETILLRAPRSGRSLFFGGRGAPLQREDPRLWDIPFATRRPTFQELQRVLHKLTTLHVYEEDFWETVRLHSPQAHRKTVRKERKKPTEEERKTVPSDENEALGQNGESPKQGSESEDEDGSQVGLELVELTLGTLDLREFEVLPKRRRRKRNKKEKTQDPDAGAHVTLNQQPQEDEPISWSAQVVTAPFGSSVDMAKAPAQLELWDVLLAACRAGDIGKLRLQLTSGAVDHEVISLLSAPLGSGGFTLLHAAAAAGRGSVVWLLLEAGADPTVQDSQAQPPYAVAADRETRNEFRRFMEKNPDAYDYDKAQVPGPLTPEMEARRATRKREQKAARRQREEQQWKQQEQEEREQKEQQRFAALSDREKRALAAERRLAAQLGVPTPPIADSEVANARRCWNCGASLQGLIPFHYFDFSFCSTRCLRDHRSQAGRPSS
ncbi:ankyrin repeat and zinc finger domain-containing protein 1 isoform X1 [Fukomys damarensis]|uniref:ankyrin repeat and zinc finger domain-containing protein 1 isoform X1 n=2 Tax=Fukomys damarensis TaxID=885580 RepID=UPI00053F6F41|nr:ankyrin repeat and zinc finger domain-containing protein 1 isoform X1 [Fukomys damarensis]XP_010610143.1 ankyrin repeat and zinc finger domain-containing protein 1 isoform X1 [Fukomys damarensis]XP_010610144.1 ankyrin repeat and zinc finger domain-containing protein 1 isoform X1 [Fukomys damarensis]